MKYGDVPKNRSNYKIQVSWSSEIKLKEFKQLNGILVVDFDKLLYTILTAFPVPYECVFTLSFTSTSFQLYRSHD